MTFEKTVVHAMSMPYAIGPLGPGASPAVACAPEDHGAAVRIDPPYREARVLAPGPGGCMALVFDPVAPSDLYAISGCFLGYRFQGAGIDRIRGGGPPERVLTLPFAHRIGFVRRGGRRYLLAASLAADKKDPSDWSQPGALYAAELGPDPGAHLRLEPVVTGLHRNHGFLLAEFQGRPSLLLGATEGLLAVDLAEPGGWPVRQVLPGETSEVALFDLDGDGQDELVTIEPFHGNALRAYRRSAGGWAMFWEGELDFGHCLVAGLFEGRRTVLASSRAGGKELLLFVFDGPRGQPRRIVVEAGAGAANMIVLSHAGKDRILSTNQAAGEVALYTPRDESASGMRSRQPPLNRPSGRRPRGG